MPYIMAPDLNDYFVGALQELSKIARGQSSAGPVRQAEIINYFRSMSFQDPMALGRLATPSLVQSLQSVVERGGAAFAAQATEYSTDVNNLNRRLFEPAGVSLVTGEGAVSSGGRIRVPPAPQTAGAQTSGASAGGKSATTSDASHYQKWPPPERDEDGNPLPAAEASAPRPGDGPVDLGGQRAGLGPTDLGAARLGSGPAQTGGGASQPGQASQWLPLTPAEQAALDAAREQAAQAADQAEQEQQAEQARESQQQDDDGI